MPIRQEDIFEVLNIICEEKELYVTTKESVKGGLIAGCSTIVGGLLFGPPGMMLGGTVGGILACKNSQHFQPVGKILMNLPQKKKDYLHQKITSIISHLDATDAVMLLGLIRADVTVYKRIVDFIQDFIKADMNMALKS